MRAFLIALFAAVTLYVAPSKASAQVVVVGPIPRVVYSPVVPAYPRVVVAVPPIVTSYSPVFASPPVVSYDVAPVAAYEPVIPAPPAVVVYRPTVTAYRVPAVVGVGPSFIIRPKIYVPGQPVRNILRAVTP